jgi:predicted ATPase
MGEVLGLLGELPQARTHLERAISLYNNPEKRVLAAISDPGVASLSIAALNLWLLGYPEQALKKNRESLTLAQELCHPFSLAYAFHCAAALCQCLREVQATQQHAEALIELSHERGFMLRAAAGVPFRGWALSKQGREQEGITQIRQGLAAAQATGARLWQPDFLAMLAEAYGAAGQPDEGLTALAEGLDLASRTGYAVSEPALYRLKGELLLMRGASNALQAESCFQRAIEIAREQSAKSWELRATTSLARLLGKQGRRDEARSMLAEIYNWFTEGFDTADLKDAKVLLGELAA